MRGPADSSAPLPAHPRTRTRPRLRAASRLRGAARFAGLFAGLLALLASAGLARAIDEAIPTKEDIDVSDETCVICEGDETAAADPDVVNFGASVLGVDPEDAPLIEWRVEGSGVIQPEDGFSNGLTIPLIRVDTSERRAFVLKVTATNSDNPDDSATGKTEVRVVGVDFQALGQPDSRIFSEPEDPEADPEVTGYRSRMVAGSRGEISVELAPRTVIDNGEAEITYEVSDENLLQISRRASLTSEAYEALVEAERAALLEEEEEEEKEKEDPSGGDGGNGEGNGEEEEEEEEEPVDPSSPRLDSILTLNAVAPLEPGDEPVEASLMVLVDGEKCDEIIVTIDPPEEPEAPEECETCQVTCAVTPGAQSQGVDGTIYPFRGEEVYRTTDLTIRGRGLHWRHTRTYRSRDARITPQGANWTSNYQDWLTVLSDGRVRAHAGVSPGDVDRFDDWEPDPDHPGAFIAPPGIFSTLLRSENGTGDVFTLIDRDGTRRAYTLVKDDDAAVAADQDATLAMLSAIEDRNGNRLELFYENELCPALLTRVSDTLGRDIIYEYTPLTPENEPIPARRGRLKRIRDFTGRQIRFDYDEHGNLIEARTPRVTGTPTGNDFPEGKLERYRYFTEDDAPELAHKIKAVIRPNENDPAFGLAPGATPALRWTYDEEGRVASHTLGAEGVAGAVDGAAGGTATYTYEENPAAPADFDPDRENPAIRLITETDRNGNVRKYWIDEGQQITRFEHFTRGVREEEPEKYLRRYKLSGDRLATASERPEGDRDESAYDQDNADRRQQGNALATTRLPDERAADQQNLQWRYVYDPFYNQPCIRIDPRAFDPDFEPPSGGEVTPERYAEVYIFDYQEGPDTAAHKARLAERFGMSLAEVNQIIEANERQVEAALGLPEESFSLLGKGDLNGDGRTDQIAGNHVLHIQPSVRFEPGANQSQVEGRATQKIVTAYAYDDHGLKLYEVDPVGNVTDYVYFSAADPNGDGEASEVTDPRGGHGYLKQIIRDSRQLPGVTPRLATAQGLDFLELTTRYERDPVGNITARTDPRGNTWLTIYNQLDQPVRRIDPAPYEYKTDLIYDANDNIVERRVQNRTPALDDGKPLLDAQGNPAMQAGAAAGEPDWFVHRYRYDILDNRVIADIDAAGSDPDRLVTRYAYDANENRTLIVKPEGNQVARVYDERDLLFTETTGAGSAEASTITSNYDRNRNLVARIDAEDNTGEGQPERTVTIYDGFNRLKRVIDGIGNVLEYTYDPNSNRIAETRFGPVGGPSPTDVAGENNVQLSQTRYRHDEVNRLYQRDRLLAVAPGTELERPAEIQDGPLSLDDGFVSRRTEYDADSRITFEVEDDLDATRHQYDGADRRILSEDARGNTQDYVYDENDNVIRHTSTELSDEPQVQPDQVITTENTFDVHNRLTRSVDNLGNEDLYAHDSRDNHKAHRDAERNTKLTIYDGASRVIARHTDLREDGTGATPLDPDQSHDGRITVRRQWDGNSRLAALIDDNGNKTRYEYDELDRKVQVTYGLTVDPELADQKDPPTTETYVYDRDHNLVRFTDQNETTFTHTYDGLNRRTRTEIAFAAGNPHNLTGTTLKAKQYDGLSRETLCTDNNAPGDARDDVTCTYAYDTLSRTLEERQRIGTHPRRTTSYVYDESSDRAGDLQPIAHIYPDGRRLALGYDVINRMTSIADQAAPEGSSPIAAYTWIGPAQRTVTRTHGNGTESRHTYDGIRRTLTKKTVSAGDGPGDLIIGFEHAYDREDNKRFERKLHDPGRSELYDYDSAYRLVNFERGKLSPGGATITERADDPGVLTNRLWELDGLGNWQRHVFGQGGAPEETTRTRAHTNFNEIFEAEEVLPDGSTVPADSFGHDDNGNQTEGEDRTLTWDAFNRLREIRDRASGRLIARYGYDCDNRRMIRHTETLVTGGPGNGNGNGNGNGQGGPGNGQGGPGNGQGGPGNGQGGPPPGVPGGPPDGVPGNPPIIKRATTHFYYDGWRVCEEYTVNENGIETLKFQYVWGATYLDELIARDDRRGGVSVLDLNADEGDARQYQHCNTLHSIFAVTDQAGEVLERYQYDPYGNRAVFDADFVLRFETAIAQEYSYTGQRLDLESGLYYYKNRYYSAV